MSKLLSRSKHEEFESNSTSYIRDQEERRAENRRKRKQGTVGTVANGTLLEISLCWVISL